MTAKEKSVIEWAFNLAHAIVAGDYNLPKPMCRAINSLQDEVHALSYERGYKSIDDGCSKEFLADEAKYWNEIESKLKEA